ncbi:MAG: glycosyltransferase [bacterium]|nr:glycosyltransferase [bacterium]
MELHFLPKVSVIVPVYNGERTLMECLNSLMKLKYPRDRLEIIVVDNNSTDRTKEIATQFPVTYVFERHRNWAAAKNRGLTICTGELVAFLSHDCIIHRDWISEFVKEFQVDEVGGCGGNILPYRIRNWIDRYYYQFIYSNKRWVSEIKYPFPWIIGLNSIFRRNDLIAIGGFDEKIGRCDDVDISWRVQLKGRTLKYISQAIVYHDHENTFRAFFKGLFEAGYSYYPLVKKYQEFINFPLSCILRNSLRVWREAFKRAIASFMGCLLGKNFENMVFLILQVVGKLIFTFGKIIFCISHRRVTYKKVKSILLQFL